MITDHELRARVAAANATQGSDGLQGRPAARSAQLLRLRVHAALDDVAGAVGKWLHTMGHTDLARVSRETDRALTLFERQGWLAEPAAYHGVPQPLTRPVVEPQVHRGREFDHVRFNSEYRIHRDEPGGDRWSSHEYRRNRVAHARVLRHDDPTRPWVVCVHGTGMGWNTADFRAFDVDRLHRDLGLNVALPVLPLSGPRRPRGRFQIQFPTNDHLDNVHGLAQSVWDLRRLTSWIRSIGGERIATHGVSLGGYVVALHAAFEPDLSCAIAGIPVSDFMTLFAGHQPRDPFVEVQDLVARGSTLHRVVSPLEFAPTPAVDRRFIYCGLGDRFLDPVEQAYALWEHWDEPSVLWYEGGHVGFALSGVVRDFVTEALHRSGLLEHLEEGVDRK